MIVRFIYFTSKHETVIGRCAGASSAGALSRKRRAAPRFLVRREATGLGHSIRVAAGKVLPQRERDDLDVEPEGPVLHVVQIELHSPHHLFDAVGLASIAVDLRPAGYARLDPVAMHVAPDDILVDVVVLERMRTWSDDGH